MHRHDLPLFHPSHLPTYPSRDLQVQRGPKLSTLYLKGCFLSTIALPRPPSVFSCLPLSSLPPSLPYPASIFATML
jgi:hypothetical protein